MDQALMVNLNERNRMRNIKRKIYNTKYRLILRFFYQNYGTIPSQLER